MSAFLDGHEVEFLHKLPAGARYYRCAEYASDPRCTPYVRGQGPDDRAAKDIVVILAQGIT